MTHRSRARPAASRDLRAAGLRVVFLTNNSSGRVRDNLARLAAAGVEADADDLVTSAQAAAAMLGEAPAPGARVLACAGPGVIEALQAHGFETVDAVPAAAVVVGWHRDFDFERLRRAADGVRAGARFVATNLDPTYPGTEGLLPGAGSLVAAVADRGRASPGGRGQAGTRHGRTRTGPLRRADRDDRRPPVDRRRVRGRARVCRSHSCSRVSRGRRAKNRFPIPHRRSSRPISARSRRC